MRQKKEKQTGMGMILKPILHRFCARATRRAQRGNWLPNAPSVTKLICASYAPGYKNTQGAKGLDAPGPWGAGALEPVVIMKGGQKSVKYMKLVLRPLMRPIYIYIYSTSDILFLLCARFCALYIHIYIYRERECLRMSYAPIIMF